MSPRQVTKFLSRLRRHPPELRKGGWLAAPASKSRVRDPPRRAWEPPRRQSPRPHPTRAHGPRRPGGRGHLERQARNPASARSPKLTWRLAAASRAACGRGPGGTAVSAGRTAAGRPPASPFTRRPLRAPGERRARVRGGGGGAAWRDSRVGEGGRGRRRLLLHDCLPGCIVGV